MSLQELTSRQAELLRMDIPEKDKSEYMDFLGSIIKTKQGIATQEEKEKARDEKMKFELEKIAARQSKATPEAKVQILEELWQMRE